jgi:putative SOS response-associated peptidase YedK
MVMVNGCEQMSDAHDRMPTILHRDQWTNGTPDEAIALAQVCELPPVVHRTPEPWIKARLSGAI